MLKIIFILFCLSGLSNNCAFAETKEIVMGFSPAENASSMESKGKLFAAYLEKKLGVKIKIFIAMDYTALIEALRSGNVQFAWLPPFSFVQAEKIADGKVLLKVVRHGKAVLYSAVIARVDHNYKSLEDLKGKTIAWVDPASSTGHIIPKATILEQKKIDPDQFFGRQVFAGGHDSVVLAVLNGTVDAGATWLNDPKGLDGSWHLYLKEKAAQIKPVFISPPIPSDTLVSTNKFAREEAALTQKMVKLLLGISKDAEGKKFLQDLYGVDGLVEAKSAEYDIIRKAAKISGAMK